MVAESGSVIRSKLIRPHLSLNLRPNEHFTTVLPSPAINYLNVDRYMDGYSAENCLWKTTMTITYYYIKLRGLSYCLPSKQTVSLPQD